MCGIVGYVGKRPCRDLIVAGLEKLEYRGYDSAGISLLADGHIDSVRAVGNLANLREAVGLVADQPVSTIGEGAVAVAAPPATIGLGHTRWATHGRVTEENAHPHGDCADNVHIVLNGIVENHAELRRDLTADGHIFSSDTDAEIVAHLIEKHYDGDLTEAVRASFAEMRGHYAFVAMHAEQRAHAGRRAPGVPADRRARRGRDLRRLGDPRLPGRDPDGARAQERRDRDRRPRRRPDHRSRRQPDRARRPRGHLGRGHGREGRLRDLHAEGDPRAGRLGRRDDHRPPPRARRRRPLRARAVGGADLRRPPDRDRRVRHQLPRRARRPVRDRAVGPGAG